MSRLLLLRPRLTASALGLTTYSSYTLYQSHRFPSRLDSLSSPISRSSTPIVKRGGGLDPKSVRQISSGSIIVKPQD
ncbi:0411c47a-0d26-4cda-bb40-b499f044536d [Sclerotinia trifoliorum]|uniref:0411c47a-0d26-4cda-bb40-b499f044536d n=1 Tax=Sclerotinia trifoliorum TaxID=28548 RepID=A0A8H2VLC3_9HELO|nr:0411c47a-0d26-4cda-bb40-b499f044536d [Sclerotinia trifoliorum]